MWCGWVMSNGDSDNTMHACVVWVQTTCYHDALMLIYQIYHDALMLIYQIYHDALMLIYQINYLIYYMYCLQVNDVWL